ncbi:MAG: YwiC-like family protein [Dermatophilaceae bacterium]
MTTRRRGPGWVPTQHGAWVMLASPLLIGTFAAGVSWRVVPLAAAWFAGYLAFFATSLWLKSGRKPRYWPPVRTYAVLAAALGLLTVAVWPPVLAWAPAFATLLGIALWAAARRRERDTLVGLTTVLMSSLMTVVAYQVSGGTDLARAALLALVQFLYLGGTVLYVKSLIRERANPRFRLLSVGCHAVATLLVLPASGWLALVFALLTVRAALVPGLTPRPAQVGVGELVSVVAVGLVSLATV